MKGVSTFGALGLLGLLVGCLLLGCGADIAGSGNLATRAFDLAGFARVEAGSVFVIDIAQSSGFRVAITADDNLFQYLDVSVSGSTLRLRVRPGVSLSRATLRATITMPALEALSLSGAAKGNLTGFQSTAGLSLNLSGASDLTGNVVAGDMRVEASGASRVTLTGSGGNLSLNGSGASKLDLGSLAVRDADVKLSGASHGTVNASGRLDAELSGASTLVYRGNPTLGRIETSGGSTLRQG